MIEQIKSCKKCKISNYRTQVVIPRGNPKSKLFFIGEAPGKDEDKKGMPFVGRAGQWFEHSMSYLRLTENDYYLTNIIKCRPFDGNRNRKPFSTEVDNCFGWLQWEIKNYLPETIVLMGKTALETFFPYAKLKDIVGNNVLEHKNYTNTKFFVIYHPAVLIYHKEYYKPIYKRHLDSLEKIIK